MKTICRSDCGFRPSLGNAIGEQMSPETAFDSIVRLIGDKPTKTGEAYIFAPGPKAAIGPQMPGDLLDGFHGSATPSQCLGSTMPDFPQANWCATPIDVLPEVYFNHPRASANIPNKTECWVGVIACRTSQLSRWTGAQSLRRWRGCKA